MSASYVNNIKYINGQDILSSSIEKAMEVGGEETENQFSGKRVRSCRAITLTCWLAFLSFAVIIIHSILAAFKDLATKEEFWQSTNRMIASFEKYKNKSSSLS